jgi:hypothetical protein
VHRVEKDSDEVVMGIYVQKFEEAFRQSPDIFVAHAEDAEAGENDYDSLRKLPRGDGAHAFDVPGVADSGMRDSGMHLVKLVFRFQRLVAESF